MLWVFLGTILLDRFTGWLETLEFSLETVFTVVDFALSKLDLGG